MFPVAREGDPITHDLQIPSGVIGPPLVPCPPNLGQVFIEGMPAAHVNCTVLCTGATSMGSAHSPPPPGVPPLPILIGAPTVFIHGMPAARWAPSGDMGGCGVFLGDPKLAAARTVIIGGPSTPAGMNFALQPNGDVKLGAAITITGTTEFKMKAIARIQTVASVPTGARVLGAVEKSGKAMTIDQCHVPNSYAGPHDYQAATAAGASVFDGMGNPKNSVAGTQLVGTGAGSDVTVSLNPDLTLENPLDPTNPMPNDAVLFHEMNHGVHQMQGTYDGSPVQDWDTQEEKATISTGSPSEANYLEERRYPWKRTSHGADWAPNP